MNENDHGSDTGARAKSELRRWEAVLPREEIAQLLAEHRWHDLLGRLGEARARWPRDLELLRSVRVIEDFLKTHPEER
jgi:hypothetical protein